MMNNMNMGDFVLGSFTPIISLFLMVLGFIILYLIIRIAVRHGIESSDVARMLREQKDRDDRDR